MSIKRKIIALFAAFALLALPGCATVQEYGKGALANAKSVVDSFEVDVSEDSASVSAVGLSASLNWKTLGCVVVGFIVPSLCEEDEPEAE